MHFIHHFTINLLLIKQLIIFITFIITFLIIIIIVTIIIIILCFKYDDLFIYSQLKYFLFILFIDLFIYLYFY
jgi:hypothetical protein